MNTYQLIKSESIHKKFNVEKWNFQRLNTIYSRTDLEYNFFYSQKELDYYLKNRKQDHDILQELKKLDYKKEQELSYLSKALLFYEFNASDMGTQGIYDFAYLLAKKQMEKFIKEINNKIFNQYPVGEIAKQYYLKKRVDKI